ncbi:MAG: MFS transporter [Candidatus Aenigmarchaeota archaeon]|nr:MFS transporter [Candidatus Aenigmarchaeota archaeon]
MKLPALLQFLYSFGFNLVYRTLPAFLATLSASAVQISLVHTAYNGAGILKVPFGAAVDRLGKKRGILISFLAISLLAGVLSVATTIPQFILLFFLLGLTANVYYSSINALVADRSRNKTAALFRLESAYQLGFVLGPLLGGALALRWGMAAAFWAWAILGAAGFLLSMCLPAGGEPAGKRGMLAFLRSQRGPLLLVLGIGGLFTGFIQSVLDLAIPLYATSLGMDIAQVGMLFAGAAILTVVSMLLLGSRMDRWGERRSLAVMVLCMGLPFLFLPFARDLVSLAILAGISSVGRAAGLNIARAFIARRVGPAESATGMGACDTLQYAGRVAGPLAAGAVIEILSFAALFWGVAAVALLGLAALAAFPWRGEHA